MKRNGARNSRYNKGFSLVEIILSIGIATVIFLGLLLLLMSTVTTNRMTSMLVAGVTASRTQAEETLSLARSAVLKDEIKGGADAEVSTPMAFLTYLTSDSLPGSYSVSTEGSPITKIICTFPVSDPGYAARNDAGERVVGKTTTGTMTVYLDESEVPLRPNDSAPGTLWSDLSLGSSETSDVGFDINADGKIHNGGLLDSQLQFDVANIPSAYRRIVLLPVDFRIEFTDLTGKMTYATDYRVIISDTAPLSRSDGSDDASGGGGEGSPPQPG